MPSDSKNYSDLISRRRFVELAGVSGAAALAGCGGDGEGNGNGNGNGNGGGNGNGNGGGNGNGNGNGNGSGDVIDVTHVSGLQANPVERTLNTLHTQLASEPARRLAFDRYAAYSFEDSEFLLSGLDGWEFDGETVTLTLRDDLTWSDGSQITTEDVNVQFQLLEKVGNAIFDYVESYEVVDDLNFQLNLTGPTNPTMVKFQLANMWFDIPAATYEQFLDADAEEIQTYMVEDEADEVLTSGPFTHVDRNQQEWNFERNTEYRMADNVNFSDWQFDAYQEASVPAQDFSTGATRLDSLWSGFFPPDTVDQFADHVVEHASILAKWGYGMTFNHDDEVFGDRAVRQAIAYVVNRQEIVDNAGPRTKFPASVPCGIAPKNINQWLGEKKEQYESYGVDESDQESATQVLEEAGYTMEDGTWHTPDGEPVSAEYLTPAGWTDWLTATETVVDRLNEFGFDMTVATQPTGDWMTSISESNFRITAYFWLPGQARSSFPYFPLRHQIVFDQLNGGHNYPAEEEQTIPGMDGGEMTLVPREKVAEIGTVGSEEEARPIVQEAAWHNNIDLPFISLVSKFEQSWLTDDDWNIDKSEPHWSVKWPTFWLPRQGQLTAKDQ